MELTIKDRLYLPALLPRQGTFREFNLKKGILEKIAITDAEREAVGLHRVEETDRIEWDTDKEMPLTADFSREELELLKNACEKIAGESLADDMWLTVEKVYDAIQAAE
jgi:hypothetical protein